MSQGKDNWIQIYPRFMQSLPPTQDPCRRPNSLGTTLLQILQPLSIVLFFSSRRSIFRLSQTLMWLDNFHWIIVEDAEAKTPLVENFLAETNLQYIHLVARTKKNKQLKPTVSFVLYLSIIIHCHQQTMKLVLLLPEYFNFAPYIDI